MSAPNESREKIIADGPAQMNSSVTDWELTLILLASLFAIVIILFIVCQWLNFHLLACCFNCLRNRKISSHASPAEQSTEEPLASFIDLSTINEPLKHTHDSSLWTPAVGSISSLITNDTTYDDTPMPNGTSAYDIVSYANNIKSTLKRTISCQSDDQFTVTSLNDLHMTEEQLGLGKLQITINYNVLEEYLEILFLQARDLVIAEGEQTGWKVHLTAWLDDDRPDVQSSQLISYERNLTVTFNASMRWKVDDDRLPCTVLHTSVYARDDQTNETLLGECSFTIGEIYIYQPLTTWLNLYENDATCTYLGEISVSLCYHPTADRLTCSLIQARNLTFHQRESLSGRDKISTDCYATISLLHRHQVVKKTRTSSHYATDRNPVFNQTSVFNVSSADLLTSYIRIVIYENVSSTKTCELGHCLIGNHDRSQQTSHWQQMLRVLRRPVIVWHALKL